MYLSMRGWGLEFQDIYPSGRYPISAELFKANITKILFLNSCKGQKKGVSEIIKKVSRLKIFCAITKGMGQMYFMCQNSLHIYELHKQGIIADTLDSSFKIKYK